MALLYSNTGITLRRDGKNVNKEPDLLRRAEAPNAEDERSRDGNAQYIIGADLVADQNREGGHEPDENDASGEPRVFHKFLLVSKGNGVRYI